MFYSKLFYAMQLTAILLLSISIREFAKTYVAYMYNDDTAKNNFNFSNYFEMPNIIIPIALYFLGMPMITFANAMPINYGKLKKVRKAIISISLTGIFIHILIAVISLILLRLNIAFPLQDKLFLITKINIMLAVFNSLPLANNFDGYNLISTVFDIEIRMYNPIFLYIIIYVLLYTGFLSIITNYISTILIGILL